jgi:site-specific recombinase XerD
MMTEHAQNIESLDDKAVIEFIRRIACEEIKKAGTGVQEQQILPTKTLSEFAKEFAANVSSRLAPNTISTYADSMNDFIRCLGDVQLKDVGVMDIERYLSIRSKQVSDFTVQKHFRSLASMFETAKKWGFLARNPFRILKKPPVKYIQAPHFSQEEFRKLLRIIPRGSMRDIVICGVFSGMRRNELINLHWDQVDLNKKLVHVENSEDFKTKTGRSRAIPMHPNVERILLARKKIAIGKLVFHNNGMKLTPSRLSQGFKQYVRLAGLGEKLHFHSLRHTFGTWLVEQGVPIYEIQKLMGHSTIVVTEMYSHLDTEMLHHSIGKMNLIQGHRTRDP